MARKANLKPSFSEFKTMVKQKGWKTSGDVLNFSRQLYDYVYHRNWFTIAGLKWSHGRRKAA